MNVEKLKTAVNDVIAKSHTEMNTNLLQLNKLIDKLNINTSDNRKLIKENYDSFLQKQTITQASLVKSK